MGKDVFTEAAKKLSKKLGVTIDEARVLVFVGHWQQTKGSRRSGPFPEKMIEDGWVNDAFVTSSGMSKSDIQSMFSKGHLYPRQVQNEDRTARYDYHWMRVSDNVDQAVQESFADLG